MPRSKEEIEKALSELKAELETAEKGAKEKAGDEKPNGSDSADIEKSLRALVAEIKASKKPSSGEIKGLSEDTAHALLEELRAFNGKLAEGKKKGGWLDDLFS